MPKRRRPKNHPSARSSAGKREPKRQRIYVAVPCRDNALTASLRNFLAALVESVALRDRFEFEVRCIFGLQPVEYARNWLVGRFLESRCDRLWFLDNDMVPFDTTANVLASPHNITSAMMMRFVHRNTTTPDQPPLLSLCAFTRNHEGPEAGRYTPFAPKNGDPRFVEVDAVGTGCTVYDRAVFEDQSLWLPDRTYEAPDGSTKSIDDERDDPKWAPPVFRTTYKPNGEIVTGEDVDFAWRAKSAGYTVATDLIAKCGHFKPVELFEIHDMCSFAIQRVVEQATGLTRKVGDTMEREPAGDED